MHELKLLTRSYLNRLQEQIMTPKTDQQIKVKLLTNPFSAQSYYSIPKQITTRKTAYKITLLLIKKPKPN